VTQGTYRAGRRAERKRLSACSAARPLITFLLLHGHLRPGYDYLLERKFSTLWR
jgi:hypothetical protein